MKRVVLTCVLALLQVGSLHSETCVYPQKQGLLERGNSNEEIEEEVTITVPSSTQLYAAPEMIHTAELLITNNQVKV